MLQTRAGRCPACKEEVAPTALVCPACGKRLPQATASSSPGTTTRKVESSSEDFDLKRYAKLFFIFVFLCALLMAGATLGWKIDVPFFRKPVTAPELEASHSAMIQDAELFRSEISGVRDSNGEETAAEDYIQSVNMPRGGDQLEITLYDAWKTIDYRTRLNFAKDFSSRWRKIHAPHRAYFILLDGAAKEIGGRTWTGKVWVQEKHKRETKPPADVAQSTPTTATDAPDDQDDNDNDPVLDNPVENEPEVDRP